MASGSDKKQDLKQKVNDSQIGLGLMTKIWNFGFVLTSLSLTCGKNWGGLGVLGPPPP